MWSSPWDAVHWKTFTMLLTYALIGAKDLQTAVLDEATRRGYTFDLETKKFSYSPTKILVDDGN